jgi:hypothetical protein
LVPAVSSSSPHATARTLNDTSTAGMIRFLITSPWLSRRIRRYE